MFREDPEPPLRQRRETETNSDRDREQAGQGGLRPCLPSLSHSSLSYLSVSSRPPSALRADPELPFLEMAWSPSHMQEFFNHQVLPAVWPGQHVTAVTIEDIRYEAGNQCEVLYSLQCGAPTAGHSQRAVVTFASQNKLGRIYQH